MAEIETVEAGALSDVGLRNATLGHGRKHRRRHAPGGTAGLFLVAIGFGRGRHVVAMRSLGHAFMMASRSRDHLTHRHCEWGEGKGRCNQHEKKKAYAHARTYGGKAIYWQRHDLFITPGLALSSEYVYDKGDAAASVIRPFAPRGRRRFEKAPGAQVEERRIW